MKHLDDVELIALAYGEDDQDSVREHLAECAECARNYSSLRSDLAEIKFADAPRRGVLYGHQVWTSISGLLPAYGEREHGLLRRTRLRDRWLHRRLNRWLQGLTYAAACAGLAVCAFLGGRLWEHKQVSTVAATHPRQSKQPSVAQPPPRVVVVILSDHLDRSERLLVQLKHADADNAGMVSPLRDEARSLLAANGICREQARQTDDPALATALDLLGHLLTELASQPGGVNSANITKLQNEINADRLLFEVRVLRSRQGASTEQVKGGTI